ncbi:MAG: hypothetical protein IIC49_06450 [Planctomycetes bacterium]|nr:hypothetical protein [Planctomycetota bacterium]
MSNLIGWVKANVWIVILSTIALAVYPSAWAVSSGWNKRIRADLQGRVTSDYQSVDVKVAYSDFQIDPNVPPVEMPGVAPNTRITEYFRARRDKQLAQLQEVIAAADEFNRRGRGPLIEGLFPEPTGEDADLKRLAMNELFVSGPAHPPSVYEQLLASINAGPVIDPTELAALLVDLRERESAAREASDGQIVMTPEERDLLDEKIINSRMAEYRRHANEISVYADMRMFPELQRNSWPEIWPDRLGGVPTLSRCFLWQHDYWAVSDVLEAVGRANTDVNGEPTAVTQSPVKRIASLRFTAPLVPGWYQSKYPLAGSVQDAGAQQMHPDYAYGITGRFTSPDNRLYDVRHIELEVVVAAEKLPRFFDALAQTNFITVTDIDLKAVDVATDLERGLFYGPDYVVSAKIALEVLLLRSWTEPLMPETIKLMLAIGVPDQDAADLLGAGENESGSGEGGEGGG